MSGSFVPKRRENPQKEITDFYNERSKRRRIGKTKKSDDPGRKHDEVVRLTHAADAWSPSASQIQRSSLAALKRSEQEQALGKDSAPGLRGLSGKLSSRLHQSIQQSPRSVLPAVEEPHKVSRKKTTEVKEAPPRARPSAIEPLRRPPRDVVVKSAEPVLYDPSLLPQRYVRLLRIMDGLESANVFSRSRKQPRMRLSDITVTVSKHAGCTFTEDDLACLVNNVPEAFHIYSVVNKRGDRDLEVELLDPADGDDRKKAQRLSPRRALLHRRLLRLLQEDYCTFLDTLSLADRESWDLSRVPWHPDFDIDAHARDPERCNLWDIAEVSIAGEKVAASPQPQSLSAKSDKHERDRKESFTRRHEEISCEPGGIEEAGKLNLPLSLLTKVRQRERAAQERRASGLEERQNRSFLLSQLVTTLPMVRSALGARSRMDLGVLVEKLRGLHRGPVAAETLHLQLSALAEELPEIFSITSAKPLSAAKSIPTRIFHSAKSSDFAAARRTLLDKRSQLNLSKTS